MITTSKEYEKWLSELASAPPILKMRIPTTEPIYEIDWNSRKVSAPQFIGVAGDHESEIIFFKMDRFYDNIDLSNSIGVIQFKNARQEEYQYVIPRYDIESIRDKIIFPWVIQAPVALYSGTVSFSFKFFQIDQTDIDEEDGKPKGKLIYELNSLVAKTKVLVGWSNYNGANYKYNTLDPNSLIIDNEFINNLNTIIKGRKYMTIYWLDTTNYEQGSQEEQEDVWGLDDGLRP